MISSDRITTRLSECDSWLIRVFSMLKNDNSVYSHIHPNDNGCGLKEQTFVQMHMFVDNCDQGCSWNAWKQSSWNGVDLNWM